MGKTQEDVMRDGNNFQKEATVSSFWMDQTEITNLQYREYTDWIREYFGKKVKETILIYILIHYQTALYGDLN